MRITLFTHGSRGDVWPFIALGDHLRERDHDVTIAAPPNYAALVRAAGLRYGPLPFDAEAFLASDEGRRLTAVGGLRMVRAIQVAYAEHVRAFDDDFIEASEGAEALVAMHITMERAQVIAEYRRLPLAMVWPTVLTPTGEFSSPVLQGRELPTRALRRASHLLLHRVWAAGSAGQTAALRRRLGLPSSRTPAAYRHQDLNALCLNTFSPSIVPRPCDWGPQERISGSWRMPDRVRRNLGERIPAALQSWLEAGEAPLYLGLGSMPVFEPAPLLDDIRAATAAVGARTIVHAGWATHGGTTPDPGRMFIVDGPLDHDRLLPRCRAAVHHGGAGTTTTVARAGLPALVVSVGFEQPWWGRRLERLGVGHHLRFANLDSKTLETGLRTVLDPHYAVRAAALGHRMRGEPDGAQASARMLEDWLVTAEPQTPPRPAAYRIGGDRSRRRRRRRSGMGAGGFEPPTSRV
jgi:sterol 3beta-glucosyltransferase